MKSLKEEVESMNFNTILMTLILGLSGWTLSTSVEQGKILVEVQTRLNGLQDTIAEMRAGSSDQWPRSQATEAWARQILENQRIERRLEQHDAAIRDLQRAVPNDGGR